MLLLVKKVAEKEKFKVKKLDEKFDKYFVKFDWQDGDRCVDGRKPKLIDDSSFSWFEQDYLGPQYPGGSLGIVDVVRVVLKYDELQARELVQDSYESNKIRLGDHNDDDHGEIKNVSQLNNRFYGCGDQDVKAKGQVGICNDLKISREIVKNRVGWLKNNNGSYPALTGEHNELGVVVNLEEKTTFNTVESVADESSVFNCDLLVSYQVAGLIYDQLDDKQDWLKLEFQEEVAKTVLINYLQTVKALGWQDRELKIKE